MNNDLLQKIEKTNDYKKLFEIIGNNLIITYSKAKSKEESKLGESTVECFVILSKNACIFVRIDNLGNEKKPTIMFYPAEKNKVGVNLSSLKYNDKLVFDLNDNYYDKKLSWEILKILKDKKTPKHVTSYLYQISTAEARVKEISEIMETKIEREMINKKIRLGVGNKTNKL